jgi:hypothetical protein
MALSLLVCLVLVAAASAQDRLPAGPPAIVPGDAAPHIIGAGPVGEEPKKAREYKDEGINIELPGPDRLFERYSEQQLFDRLRGEAKRKPGTPKVFFPDEVPVSTETYTGRKWTRSVALVEPGYVCHGRLLFEQPNLERYGWDLGVLTPFASVGVYWYDLALLPYHSWTDPLERWDCSSGKCLPGDRVALLLYPEKFSLTGLAAQAGVIAGGFWLIP